MTDAEFASAVVIAVDRGVVLGLPMGLWTGVDVGPVSKEERQMALSDSRDEYTSETVYKATGHGDPTVGMIFSILSGWPDDAKITKFETSYAAGGSYWRMEAKTVERKQRTL